jgi:cholesterol transport system auxiliary component
MAMAPLCLALGACTSLLVPTPPALDTYALTAPVITKVRRNARVQLLVAEPTAIKAFDVQNIVVQTTANDVQFLSGAQWADRLPKVVQSGLVETFERSDAFGGIGRPGEGLAIDYQVLSDVRSFGIRSGTSSEAVVEIAVKLLNDRNGVIRDNRLFTATSAVSGTANEDYVAALDAAFDEVAADIVRWVAGRI